MPKIGEITDYTWVEKIGTDFLKADDIDNIVNQITSGDLKNIDENLSTPIRTEMGKGLSVGALNIDGRAPLNEISQELVEKIKRTSYGLEALEKVAEGEGNKHRKDEAETLYQKTVEYHLKLCISVKEAVDNYNNNRGYSVKIEKTLDDGNGGKKTIEVKIDKTYDECILDLNNDPPFRQGIINVKIDPTDPNDTNPSKHQGYVAAVDEAVKKANDFYRNYVEPAYKLKNECASLEIYELPEGVNENASCEYMNYLNGARRETYTNPDGSTVEIYYNKDEKMTNKTVKNPDGTTEFTKYDENGKMTNKTVTKPGGTSEFKKYMHYLNGAKRETYTNSDGSTVEIYYNKDGKMTNKTVKNPDGTTEFTKYDENGNEITTQTPGSSSNQQQPSSNKFYTYEDLQNDVKNKKEIIELPPGYQLVYDAPAWGALKGATSADAYITSTDDNPITLVYNGKNYDAMENYDPKDKNGNKLYSLNPERLSSGSNKFSVGIGNDTTLRYDSNNDGKMDTIASSSANQQQSIGGTVKPLNGGNSSGSSPSSHPGTGQSSQGGNTNGSN